MNLSKLLLLIFSGLVLLVGIGLIIGGGTLLYSNQVIRDQEGFYMTPEFTVQRKSHAVITEPADIDLGPDVMPKWLHLMKVKVQVESKEKDKGVFVGIASRDSLDSYLEDVSYGEIVKFDFPHPFSKPNISYQEHEGSGTPASPTEQDLWAASTHGSGQQLLTWELHEGTYSIVFMNEDGSSGLNLKSKLGLKVPMIGGLGIGLLAGGLFLLALAFLLVYATITRIGKHS